MVPVNPHAVTITPDGLGDIVGVTMDGRVVRGKLTNATTQGALIVKISHFATCKNADKFRKTNK